jgi:hypothetical protein
LKARSPAAAARRAGADPVERAAHRRAVLEVSAPGRKCLPRGFLCSRASKNPRRLVANTETLTDRYGMFTAQPFQRGFGPRSATACGACC